jgi:UTP:GlnB (protein PII) uridylyltransferase
MIHFSWTNNEDGTYTFDLITNAIQVGTLHRITAAIYTLNLDIISGDVMTENSEEGIRSKDSFIVRPTLMAESETADIPGRLGVLMEMLLARNITTEEFLIRYGTPPPQPLHFFDLRPEIVIQQHPEEGLTEFFIEAPDRRGFLFNLTRILASFGIDIQKATIRTAPNGVAQDIFYISLNGRSIDQELMDKIEDLICAGE